MTRRIPAVFITAVILFITVFSMNIFVNAASADTYTPRLSSPSKNNQYYYSDKNIFYKYGYGMPNCTAYAYGRAYEILEKTPNLCPYDADEWYDYNKSNKYYSYGSTPKLGAVACWSYNGGGGHVAVVEKIENKTITFSNSAWSGENFYLTTADINDSNAGGCSWWNFQGYIYIGNFDSSDSQATSPDNTYSTGVYKTQVDTVLNMRSGAGTSNSIVTSIPNNISLTVTKVQKGSDGYTWGYTSYNGYNGWVALEFCVFVSSTQPTTVQPTTAQPTTVQPTTDQPTTAQTTTTPKPDISIGDINLDGVISIDDATIVQKYLADISVLTEQQKAMADFDGNGIVSIEDVTLLQKFISS